MKNKIKKFLLFFPIVISMVGLLTSCGAPENISNPNTSHSASNNLNPAKSLINSGSLFPEKNAPDLINNSNIKYLNNLTAFNANSITNELKSNVVSPDSSRIKTIFDYYQQFKTKQKKLNNNFFEDFVFATKAWIESSKKQRSKESTDGVYDQVFSIINNQFKKTESKDFSYLGKGSTNYLTNLYQFADVINNNNNISLGDNITIGKLKTLYTEVVSDILNNFYYGEKVANNGEKEFQKIYENANYYENPLEDCSMLKQISELVLRGQNFLNKDLKEKYVKSLNYFVNDISKTQSNSSDRYFVKKVTSSGSNTSFDWLFKYFYYKVFASSLINDPNLLAKSLSQLKNWFNQFENILKNDNISWAKKIITNNKLDYSAFNSFLIKMNDLINLIKKITNSGFGEELQKTFEPFFKWSLSNAFNSLDSKNILQISVEQIKTLGYLAIISTSVQGKTGTELLNKIKNLGKNHKSVDFANIRKTNDTAVNSTLYKIWK